MGKTETVNKKKKSDSKKTSASKPVRTVSTAKSVKTVRSAKSTRSVEFGSKQETSAKKTNIRPVGKKIKKKSRLYVFLNRLGAILKGLFAFFLVAGIAGFTVIYFMYLRDMPDIDLSKKDNYSMASVIYDTNGEMLAEVHGVKNVAWVQYEEIPERLRNAFVAIEDKRFFEHPGVDARRLGSAIIGQLTHTSEHGGSTITQQLIKNTHLTTSRTYKRKAQEIVLALKLEREMSKEEILEWYLNDIFLGENNYGIKNAAIEFVIAIPILLVWAVATFCFVTTDIVIKSVKVHWLAFIYAVPVSMVVWLVFNSIWFKKECT